MSEPIAAWAVAIDVMLHCSFRADVAGSWVLPRDVRRRGPTAESATQVAFDQIAAVRTAQGAGAPRSVVTLDSGYDLETLTKAEVDADLLVRLAKQNRGPAKGLLEEAEGVRRQIAGPGSWPAPVGSCGWRVHW